MNWRQEGIIEVEKLGKGLVGRELQGGQCLFRGAAVVWSTLKSATWKWSKSNEGMKCIGFYFLFITEIVLILCCRKLCHEAEKMYFVQGKLDYMWKNIITLAHKQLSSKRCSTEENREHWCWHSGWDLWAHCSPKMASVPKTLLACIWIYRLSMLRLKSWMVPQICTGFKSVIICNSGQQPIKTLPFWSCAVLAIFCKRIIGELHLSWLKLHQYWIMVSDWEQRSVLPSSIYDYK